MNQETLLLRQIHPSFIQQGRVTSQAFRPTPKDENKLSVENGDQISPQDSWQRYISAGTATSVGVMAITVGECGSHNLQVFQDGMPHPEHCYVDFSPHSKKDVERISKHLSSGARSRGWLFDSPSQS